MIADFRSHLIDLDLRPRTVASYVDHVSQFSKWFEATNGQALNKSNLTQTDVRDYRAHLVTHQAAPSSINVRLSAIKAFAYWCDISIAVKAVEQQATAPRWLDRRQQAALVREAERRLNGANTSTRRTRLERDRAIIILLLNTGLRVSELCDLKPDDIKVNERSGSLVVNYGKGGKRRTVALNKEARAAIQLLTLPLGLSVDPVQRLVAEIGKGAGLEDVTPHVLRHTFAKNLADKVGIEKVASLMGHDNIQTTRRYTTPGLQDLQAAVETLE